MFLDNGVCPVSSEKIDSWASRLTVFFNVLILVAFLFTGNGGFVVVSALDYGIRAIFDSRWSPLSFLATKLLAIAGVPKKYVGKAPKLFASRVGFLCATSSALLFPVAPTASLVVAGMLTVFAILDSVFGFCVGCLLYTYLVLPLYKARGLR